jgi:ADP-heptose:LPS heptosyltransferase
MRAPRLVALRALGLGDFLTVVPALRGLRSAFPEHRIMLATASAFHGLAMATGAVDDVVDAVALSSAELRTLTLPDGCDVAVNLHGRGPQSHRALLATTPERLLGFRCTEAPDGPTWRAREHEVARWCRLLGHYGIPANPGALDLAPPAAPLRHRGVAVIHAGAKDPARRWPVDRFATVVRQIRCPVVLTGTAAETGLVQELARKAGVPPDAVLAGRTTVDELAAVVAHARLVLSGDTGVAHLATAFGTPSVTLFGAVLPEEWGPPPARSVHIALSSGGRVDAVDVGSVLDAVNALGVAA